jgi:hypothetical protein
MARHIIYGLVIKRLERFFVPSVRKRAPAGFAMPRAPASIGRDLPAPIDDFLMMASAKIKAWVAEVREDASPVSWFGHSYHLAGELIRTLEKDTSRFNLAHEPEKCEAVFRKDHEQTAIEKCDGDPT